MSETARIVFGICGITGGAAGLVGAFLFWRAGRAQLDDLKRRLNLPR